MTTTDPQIRSLLSIANGVITAMSYPAGSMAQLRCFEELAQDAKHAISVPEPGAIEVGDYRALKHDHRAADEDNETVVTMAGEIVYIKAILPDALFVHCPATKCVFHMQKQEWLSSWRPPRPATPTPGLWEAQSDNSIVPIDDSLDEIICNCSGLQIDPAFMSDVHGRAEENARLMAAAPQMLNALLKIKSRNSEDAWKDVVEAIAVARGE